MTPVRKKWIVVWYLNVDSYSPDQAIAVLESTKKSLGQEALENFFGTETMVFFVPINSYPSKMEVHEIILDAVGYDKYDAVVKNTNLDVQAVLDQLKELVDVEK